MRIDPSHFAALRWKKLKDRTDGALLDWTRQHAPPWDFVYLNCCLVSSIFKMGCFLGQAKSTDAAWVEVEKFMTWTLEDAKFLRNLGNLDSFCGICCIVSTFLRP